MYLDLLLLILILSFGVFGFLQGFAHQLVSLIALLAVFLAAEPTAQLMKQHFQLTELPHFVLWSICAFGIILIGWTIRFFISRQIRKSPLQATDRWVGFGLGLLKGVFVVMIAGLLVQTLPENLRSRLAETNKEVQESKLMNASSHLFDWNALPSIRELQQMKKNLESEWPTQTSDPEHPWNWNSEVDTY